MTGTNDQIVEDNQVDDDKNKGVDPYDGASDEDIAFAEGAGWKPREEWTGAEGKWQTAADFAADSRRINKVLNESNRGLRRELDQIKNDMGTWRDMVYAAAKKDYDTQVATLRAERAGAVKDGDDIGFDRADKALADLKEPVKPTAPPTTEVAAEARAQILDWQSKNSWYGPGGDATKTAVAQAVSATMRAELPTLVGNIPEWFAELEKRLVRDHPTLFAKKRTPVNRNEGGGGGGGGNNGAGKKTYDDLPKVAKEACDRFVRQGMLGPNEKEARQQYVDNFDWSAKV